MPRFTPLQYTDESGSTLSDILFNADNVAVTMEDVLNAVHLPDAKKVAKYIRAKNKYFKKYYDNPVFLKEIANFSNDGFADFSSKRHACVSVLAYSLLNIRTHWAHRARVNYVGGSPFVDRESDVSRDSINKLWNGSEGDAHVSLTGSPSCYDDSGCLQDVTDVTQRRGKHKDENGSPEKPWTINIYDLNKGLGLALKDFPHFEKKIKEASFNYLHGQAVIQYSIFGKLKFSII
jgi:hypothetical protein